MSTEHPTSSVDDDRSWWRLGSEGWRSVLKAAGKEFSDDEVSNLAAVVTLRIVLSLVPSMIAAVAIAAIVIDPARIESFVSSLGDVVPASSREFVTEQLQSILDDLASGSVTVAGVGAGLFAASGAAVALMGALNKTYDVSEGRGFLQKRLGSLAVLGALALSLAAMFVAIVLGPSLLELVLPEDVLNSPLNVLITLGRYVAAVGILIAFFGFAYWFAPDRDRPRFRLLTPGAVLGVTGWLVLSYLFSLYARISGSYSATYGVFAGIIVLLVWLNYSFTVLLMGAELDHEIELHLRRTSPSDGGAADAETEVAAADMDVVHADMPRHPGLVPVGTGHDAGRGAGAGDGSVGDHGGVPEDDGHTPLPRLAGAAARTPGAALASRLWGRLG